LGPTVVEISGIRSSRLLWWQGGWRGVKNRVICLGPCSTFHPAPTLFCPAELMKCIICKGRTGAVLTEAQQRWVMPHENGGMRRSRLPSGHDGAPAPGLAFPL